MKIIYILVPVVVNSHIQRPEEMTNSETLGARIVLLDTRTKKRMFFFCPIFYSYKILASTSERGEVQICWKSIDFSGPVD